MKVFPVLAIALALLLVFPVNAIEINPSVQTIPIYCRSSMTKWICDEQRGSQGIQGIQGIQGLPNFTAIFYNVTNSSLYQNQTDVFNVTNSIFYSNFTSYGGTEINESYAYLPGRDGGQTLTGGTTTGNLVLNGSANNGNIYLQPQGKFVGIGTTDSDAISNLLAIKGAAPTIGLIRNALNQAMWLTGKSITGPTTLGYIGWDRTNSGGIVSGLGNALVLRTEGFGIHLANSSTPVLSVVGSSVGIGTIAPTTQLDTTGSIRFRNCSGTPTFDAGGNLTCASDNKLKTAVTPYTSDTSKVAAITPISYKWNSASGYDTTHTNTGFDAQQIQAIYPECIIARDDVSYSQKCTGKGEEEVCESVATKTGTQTLAIDDKCLIAVLFNSVKDQRMQITTLQDQNKKQDERITALELKLGVKP
jgi:hypothetical protein